MNNKEAVGAPMNQEAKVALAARLGVWLGQCPTRLKPETISHIL